MSRLVPFHLHPISWGLKGKLREVTRAEYELEGYDLDVRLNELNNSGVEAAAELLRIQLDHHKISDIEYDKAIAKLEHTGDDLVLRLVEIDYFHGLLSEKEYDYRVAELRGDEVVKLKVKFKHHDVTEQEYEKQLATLEDRPYVFFPNIELDPSNPAFGSFSLDWNKKFIEQLEEAGYVAPKEEQIIDLWLTDLCKNIALEELSGTGLFDDQAEEAMELKRKRLGNGKTEVS